MLLMKSTCSLVFVFVTFILQSVLQLHLSMGAIALLGALLLLLLDREDIVDVLARVEWSTLIFFTSLFILMEASGSFTITLRIARNRLLALGRDFFGTSEALVVNLIP